MLTVTALVAVAAFITGVMAGTKPDWVPLWVSVVLCSIAICLMTIPK